ncbi:transmembrane 6 superfamily member 1 [Stegastes partitus]|uniref:Transmembrane 6 superfamily member 1 n=1 Tax=Stegastes partitus TaxID=144197 RepID=A0A3B5A1H5_9TELE|nr:PREDICTED: transmembrane 6 superfamily member 1 [Stegastes partitus]XP_008284875.1 PREDICTED: transmembrane 6 superfamily member 1 [Stegastes partitus]
MSASAGTGVFVLSLMSIPICYLFNSLVYNNNAEAFFFAGCTTVLILAISARFMLKKKTPGDPLFYVYAVYAFLSVVNLIIGLEQDNIIDGFVTFYLKEADPHINTAHGHMISYWDGCVHYLMYLLMIAAITWGDSYRAIGLYWVGSFLMRAIVYILGNAVGKYGTQVSPLFILHMLYIVVSVWVCFRVFSQPSTRDVQTTSIQVTPKRSLLQRPLDLIFTIYLIPALAFCIFRGLVVLDCSSKWCQDYTQQYEPYLKDPSAYPRVQMLVSMLYSGPYYVIALYGLLVPGCEWMPDLTLVHSGALAQAQFSHIGASLHTRTPFSYRVPADSQAIFLLVNVLYTLVPQALCYQCCTRPAFFLRRTAEKKNE